ncbi:hypothetical protein [Actinomadura terrae]|uniref:hypothetical protein n=1 Tax=Actinomadura terrae TaxID=604353 RepID=UPI001FA7EFC0|nr:hypothetical protein [Actinomadura terrae]
MNRFPARIAIALAAAALGLGVAPAIALAAPATTIAIEQCGSHIEDWINGNGGFYVGTLHGTTKDPVAASVDIRRERLVLTLDGHTGGPRPYEFENRTITSNLIGYSVVLDNPICRVGNFVNEATLTINSPQNPPLHLKGQVRRVH